MDYESLKIVMREFYCTAAIFSRDFYYPGYTFNEALVLDIIARHPGIIARDVSIMTSIDRGYLSKILKKLEQNGMILRRAGKHPPFEKSLSATAKGNKAYIELEAAVDDTIGKYLSVLDDKELKKFAATISQLEPQLHKIVPDIQKK